MHRREFITVLAALGAAGGTHALEPARIRLAQAVAPGRTPDVLFVPTPNAVVDKMLELAAVTGDDVVYDLGSGDGRIPITAAQTYDALGVGIDIDPQRIRESRENALRAGVADKVRFIEGDLFEAGISEATVVTLYLLTSLNAKLRPRLLRDLRPGTRIVSHGFGMGDWEPEQRVQVGANAVLLWRIPARS